MYKLYGLTDVGKVRTINEDGFVLNDVLITEGDYDDEADDRFLAVVCDGMGGENNGDLASFITLKAFATTTISSKEELRKLVEDTIQQELFRYMELHPEAKGMGTTVAGILCKNHQMTIFHIGDSRVYRFRDGILKQLTKDHSLVETLYASGQISYEEKRTHSKRNVLLRSLGQQNVKLDLQDLPYPAEVEDIFLLCSDGLTEYVTEDEMEIMLENGELEVSAKKMVQLATERGGADNITVVLIKRVQ